MNPADIDGAWETRRAWKGDRAQSLPQGHIRQCAGLVELVNVLMHPPHLINRGATALVLRNHTCTSIAFYQFSTHLSERRARKTPLFVQMTAFLVFVVAWQVVISDSELDFFLGFAFLFLFMGIYYKGRRGVLRTLNIMRAPNVLVAPATVERLLSNSWCFHPAKVFQVLVKAVFLGEPCGLRAHAQCRLERSAWRVIRNEHDVRSF